VKELHKRHWHGDQRARCHRSVSAKPRSDADFRVPDLACLWCHGASVRAPPRHSGRAQSVPKRNGTSRPLMARRGTNRQVKRHTNRLTSPLRSSDNAEADGSIPSSPTKSPGEGPFLRTVSTSIRVLRSSAWFETINYLVRGYRGLRSPVLGVVSCPLRAQSVPKGHRGRGR